jgi:nitroimidazol reductase NimA-like FMN-containing flavoprotein (pyridoxamine 5'-phosphate oxidase superfamily)
MCRELFDLTKTIPVNALKFLSRNYVARLATCSLEAIPHVSPIYFGCNRSSVFFATEKTTRKFRDILHNNRVSLVVDEFDADWLHNKRTNRTTEKAVVVNGLASIFSGGRTYLYMYKSLRNKYPDYRAEKSWMPGELPIIRISIDKVVSWGLE